MQKRVKTAVVLFAAALIFVSCSELTQRNDIQINKEIHVSDSDYELVPVRGGRVTGKDTTTKDKPSHNQTFLAGRIVEIDNFAIGKYEVSYELWYKVRKAAEKRGYIFKNKGRAGTIAALDKNQKGKYVATSRVGDEPKENTKKHPVTQISWCDAVVWCNAYSELTGKKPVYCLNGQPVKDSTKTDDCLKADVLRANGGYRLPTSTEWEWAARGGDPSSETWGNGNDFPGTADDAQLSEYACFGDKKNGSTKPVGSLKPNALGLYDMAGNVAECCVDLYAALIRVDDGVVEKNPDHPKSAVPDERDRSKFDEFERTGQGKCARGGSWKKGINDCRNGSRSATFAKYANDAVGFRAVCSN